MSLRRGSRIKQYYIEDRLGGGGMGVVWRARNTRRDEPVAIKVVSNNLISDPEFRVRMQDEARRHKRLRHPNIVPVSDVFDAQGETCIVMKLIEGESLSSMLDNRSNKRLTIKEAIHVANSVLQALDYAHRKGIVHRDVKPSNVMVDHRGGVWLLDFGIAIAMGEKRRTRTGETIGTVAYMSPEQISKPRTIDHRSDVYSVGCMFYEMLTGGPPFVKNQDGVGDSDFAIQQAHVHNTPINPRERVPSITDELADLIMRALKKDPDERIPGCGEFLRQLQHLGENSNGPNGEPTRNHLRTILILAFLLTLLLVIVFVLS